MSSRAVLEQGFLSLRQGLSGVSSCDNDIVGVQRKRTVGAKSSSGIHDWSQSLEDERRGNYLFGVRGKHGIKAKAKPNKKLRVKILY